jgi:hypothetical protein
MAALLTSQTTDTTSSGTATNADGGWIEIPNDSVFDGASITIQASSVDTAGKYSPLDRIATIRNPGWRKLELPSGTYVRAIQNGSGASTSITVNLFPTA